MRRTCCPLQEGGSFKKVPLEAMPRRLVLSFAGFTAGLGYYLPLEEHYIPHPRKQRECSGLVRY